MAGAQEHARYTDPVPTLWDHAGALCLVLPRAAAPARYAIVADGCRPSRRGLRVPWRLGWMLDMHISPTLAPLPTPGHLVGRDAELAQLRALLNAVPAERGRLVLISGEAGIGKSALVEAFSAAAQERGVLVLSGACYDLATAPPYGPWMQITEGWRAIDVLPDLPAFVDDPQALAEVSGVEGLHEALGNTMQEAAARVPLVLVLEDLHWADQASLELLRFLARRLSGLPLTILATYRDVDLTPADPLYRLLPQLVRESRALRIMPRRLTPADVEQLVQSRYPLAEEERARLVAWLDHFAEGNPFYIEELFYSLEYERVLYRDDTGCVLGDLAAVRVPTLVRQVIDERLARLDAEALRLVQIAAVIGAEAPLDLWAEVSEATDDAMADAIDAAQQARLLEEARNSGGVRFRHALIREALYHSVVLPRRRAWHRRVAEALSTRPDPDADAVAHHYQQAGDPRAASWLARAGEHSARNYAWRMAVDRLQAALDLLGTGAQDDLKRALLLYHTAMLSRRSDIDDSVRRLEESLRLARTLDVPRLVGLATADLGLLYCISGRITKGVADIWAGIALLEEAGLAPEPNYLGVPEEIAEFALPALLPAPDTRAGPAINWMAAAGRFREALERGQPYLQHLPIHPRSARYQYAYDAYIGIGHAWTMLGEPEAARSALDAAAAGYVDIAQMPWLYFLNEIAYVGIYRMDRPAERERLQRQLQDIWERTTAATARIARGQSPHGSMRLQYLRGEWDDVVEWVRSTESLAPLGLGRLAAVRLMGVIARLRGETDLAWEQVEIALHNYNILNFGDTWMLTAMDIQELAVELALDAGDLPLAAHWIEVHDDWLTQSGALIGRVEHAFLRARYLELSGHTRDAEQETRRALELATQPRQPIALLRAQRAVARFDLAAGRLDEAEALLHASLALAEECATPFEAALTQILLAELHLARNDADATRAMLEPARTVAARLRAAPTLERIATLEARIANTTSDAPPTGLTERELAVLRLVARGMTDAEVAGTLYISPRTVSGHLQSIYNKLGISSRTAAAAWAFERKLL